MLGSLLRSLRRSSVPTKTPSSRKPQTTQSNAVAFVTLVDQPHLLKQGENFQSDQASMRLRVSIPASGLARHVPVWLVPVDYMQSDPDLAQLGNPSAVVIGKLPVRFFTGSGERATALINWIEQNSSSRRIVVDFSDDLAAAAAQYSQPMLLEFQRRMLKACHATVPTESLRNQLLPQASCGISVIEDPCEPMEVGQPRFDPGRVLRLVWFGVFGNELRTFMEKHLSQIAAQFKERPIEFTLVTYATQELTIGDMARALRETSPHFSLRHAPWSLEATARELKSADIVVLPQDASSPWGRVKSHNRLVTAIRAGRFAVASAIPSYLELSSYAWIGNDIPAGIQWALDKPEIALDRVVQGQQYVAERFAPAAISRHWAKVLGL